MLGKDSIQNVESHIIYIYIHISLGSIGISSLSSDIPVNGMAGLTAWVVADLDMTLEEFHSNVVIVSIIQEDTIVLCSGHLKETRNVRV